MYLRSCSGKYLQALRKWPFGCLAFMQRGQVLAVGLKLFGLEADLDSRLESRRGKLAAQYITFASSSECMSAAAAHSTFASSDDLSSSR